MSEPTFFRCLNCRTALGVTDGRTLRCGTAVLSKPARLRCAGCGRGRLWTPARGKLDGGGKSEHNSSK